MRPQVEPFHLAFYLCLESCRQVNAPEALVFHYHHEPWGPWWDRIKPHLTLSRVKPEPFVEQSPRYLDHEEGRFIRHLGLDYAHHSDFLRLKLLIAEGGVYADIDSLFVKALPATLYAESFVIGEEHPIIVNGQGPPQASLCNAVMMARAGSPFASAWLARMYEVFDGTWSRHSCTEAARLHARMPGEIHVVPSRHFYPFMWTRDGLADLFERQVPVDDDVMSVHLWNHLWWDPRRTDFSSFHGGLLTEEYVREGATTYARLAQRFLGHPPK